MIYDNMIPVTLYADGIETLPELHFRTAEGRPLKVVGMEVENLSTDGVIRFESPYKTVTPYVPDEIRGKIGKAVIEGRTFYPAEFEKIPTPFGFYVNLYLLLRRRCKEKSSPLTMVSGSSFPSDPRC
jgi:hypothetical protein